MYPVRGRYAPSPTGFLHVGNARTALVSWLSVRSADGSFVWRLEDLDKPRVIPGMAGAAEEDLIWLGLDWDEGLDKSGPYSPYAQSGRSSYYTKALEVLHEGEHLFPCSYSRKDLQEISSAPHGHTAVGPYPVSLRPSQLEDTWFMDMMRADPLPEGVYAAIRFKVPDEVVVFEDKIHGRIKENVRNTVGDFVLKRRDGMYAYQLAVVVDDLAMEINEVVRGTDLLSSTSRQIQLIKALGGTVPAYAHVPLVRNKNGEKLSKRDSDLTLRSLRSAGIRPEQLVGYMAYSLGLIDKVESCTPKELVECFKWDRISREDWILPPGFVDQVAKVK